MIVAILAWLSSHFRIVRPKDFYDDPVNLPQRLDDLRGKTLCANLDGSIPDENPSINLAGVRRVIFTYGIAIPTVLTLFPRPGTFAAAMSRGTI